MTSPPTRIQRHRTKGWRAPLDAQGRRPVYVGRGTRWGNPWAVTRDHRGWRVHPADDKSALSDRIVGWWEWRSAAAEVAVERYRQHLAERPELVEAARRELAGLPLMCWCPLPLPGEPDHCHAAVLLLAANDYGAPAGAGVCERCWQWEGFPDKHPCCPDCGNPWSRIRPAHVAAPAVAVARAVLGEGEQR